MKSLILLFILTITSVCFGQTLQSQTLPTNLRTELQKDLPQKPQKIESKPRHIFIFIHGIGGNEESFGVMPSALVSHMDERRPGVSHEAYFFSYPTENHEMDTDDFAISLGQYLDKQLGPFINAEDKISFITHSQGGLVATIWYFHASMGKKEYFPRYAKMIDGFVTLGAPFWGSKVASLLVTKSALQHAVEPLMNNVRAGKEQLREMALGSKTNIRFRKNVLMIKQHNYDEMLKRIRPLNIAGMAKISELVKDESFGFLAPIVALKPFVFGGRHFESDSVVAIPSARFDSIYSQDLRVDYDENSFDENAQILKTKFSPFVIVKSLHASPAADRIYDLSYLPLKCLHFEDCDHPTYPLILKHLLGEKISEFSPEIPKNELSGFSLTFKVDLEEWVDAKDVEIKIEKLFTEQNSAIDVIVNPKSELMGAHSFIHPTKPWIYEKHFSGYLEYKNMNTADYRKARWQGVKAWFKISTPGHKSKIVETLLKPTYSSFIEVKLSKKIPEMRATPNYSRAAAR